MKPSAVMLAGVLCLPAMVTAEPAPRLGDVTQLLDQARSRAGETGDVPHAQPGASQEGRFYGAIWEPIERAIKDCADGDPRADDYQAPCVDNDFGMAREAARSGADAGCRLGIFCDGDPDRASYKGIMDALDRVSRCPKLGYTDFYDGPCVSGIAAAAAAWMPQEIGSRARAALAQASERRRRAGTEGDPGGTPCDPVLILLAQPMRSISYSDVELPRGGYSGLITLEEDGVDDKTFSSARSAAEAMIKAQCKSGQGVPASLADAVLGLRPTVYVAANQTINKADAFTYAPKLEVDRVFSAAANLLRIAETSSAGQRSQRAGEAFR